MSARQRLTRRNRAASSTGSSTARDSAVGDGEKKGDIERGFSPWTDLGEETMEDEGKSGPRAL